ncbi:hypothetical protein PFISCL1PPCAC_12937, partial [Pristionchus fissidentatus]
PAVKTSRQTACSCRLLKLGEVPIFLEYACTKQPSSSSALKFASARSVLPRMKESILFVWAPIACLASS